MTIQRKRTLKLHAAIWEKTNKWEIKLSQQSRLIKNPPLSYQSLWRSKNIFTAGLSFAVLLPLSVRLWCGPQTPFVFVNICPFRQIKGQRTFKLLLLLNCLWCDDPSYLKWYVLISLNRTIFITWKSYEQVVEGSRQVPQGKKSKLKGKVLVPGKTSN